MKVLALVLDDKVLALALAPQVLALTLRKSLGLGLEKFSCPWH